MLRAPIFETCHALFPRVYVTPMPPRKKQDDETFVPSKRVKDLVGKIFGDVQRAQPSKRRVPEAVQRSQDATKRELFAEALAQGLSFTAACRFANVSKAWIERQTLAHPEFAKMIEAGYNSGTDYLEDLALVRAHYSDAVLIKLLEARRPEKFRSKIGSGGPQIVVNVAPLFPAESGAPMKTVVEIPKEIPYGEEKDG